MALLRYVANVDAEEGEFPIGPYPSLQSGYLEHILITIMRQLVQKFAHSQLKQADICG
jgi:hypothetical protein